MEIDTSGIDTGQLASQINAEYDLGLVAVAFWPQGEEAYSYVADGRAGERYFIRAQWKGDAAALESVFAVTSALHTRCGLRQVVAPFPNRRGTFTCRHAGYTIAIFPWIEGTRAFEQGLSHEGLAQAASLIAAIHARGRSCSLPPVRRETFEDPFEAPILRALRAVESPSSPATMYQQRMHDLLTAERADILATLERMGRLKAAAQRLDPDPVLTHGDPNLANLLIDTGGNLHLVDWGEVALGPLERDLFHFTEERFEAFLHHYLAAHGNARLHRELFEFYTYRWVVQEIADYTTRILFDNTDPREDEHAWEELTPYLPIRHGELQAGLREIGEVLRRVAGD